VRDFEVPGRSPVYAPRGMVATSNPLAALTAIEVLRSGGNAVDAAIATAAVLCVVEPNNIGIGGDVFILYAPADAKGVIAYNGSGYAPARATPHWFLERGLTAIPVDSAHAVTIPGAIDAWTRLHADYGTKDLEALLRPAIDLAEEGYPVSDTTHFYWTHSKARLARDPGAARIFLPDGEVPRRGCLHRQPELAGTLRLIARQGRSAFYEGPVARDIVRYLQSQGGVHSLEDFAEYRGSYVEPIQTTYRSHDVFECPPNGQGIAALIMLNILSGFDLAKLEPLGAQRLHLEIEAARLAYRDRDSVICDPAYQPAPVDFMLSADYAAGLRACIDPQRAMQDVPPCDLPRHPDTTYLTIVDRDRNAISLIGSLFHSFGSALVAPESGVVLQNRGFGFTTDPDHPNAIGPRKRPMHTIIPAMVCKDGRPAMSFGVVGGRYQPWGHAHVLTNILDFGLDVQQALDLARVYHEDGLVHVERGIPDEVALDLASYGHRVIRRSDVGNGDEGPIGGGHMVKIDWESGVLIGGSDPRTDGCALGY
jgi:gamma-glutamyltranspeptidase / glutathione hydrolase